MLRKIRSKFVVALGVIVMSLTMAGCSSDSTTGNDSSTYTESSAAVKLEFFSNKSENTDILKTLAKAFKEKNKNVEITVTAPNEWTTVLKTRMAKNDLPDIIAIGGNATYTDMQSAGLLADLSNESYVSNIQDSYKQMVYDVQKDKEKKLYGVPYATNASGILYNEDIFKKNSIDIPKTWDALLVACEKLQKAGIQPFEFTFKDAWTSMCPWNSMAPDLQPANFLTDRLNGKTTFAGTHKEVAQKYLELLKYGQKDMMGTSYNDGNKLFAQGKAAMMINGNWTIPEFKKTSPNMNVNLFALPSSNDSSKNYVTSGVDILLSVSNQSKNIDQAKKFVAFLLEAENAQKYIDNQFAFSAVKGVTQNDKSVSGIKDDIANGKVANFPDHYYPSGFDLGALTQNFAKNYVAGMDATKNIEDFLSQCDRNYDASK
jgi:raffinose/stachyose/melibiose transport system substrate-binding protein